MAIITHGMSSSREYRIWRNMISRCTLPSVTHYKYYGGRGIKVCESWRKFENFIFDMGMPPSDTHSIDRIDLNGNYEPLNCRWADSKAQSRNTRWNRNFTIDGETKCLMDWCAHFGMRKTTVRNRIKAGMTPEQAFKTPGYVQMKKPTITAFGKTKTIHEWAKETGFSLRTLRYRAENGWPGDLAVTSKPTDKKIPWKEMAK